MIALFLAVSAFAGALEVHAHAPVVFHLNGSAMEYDADGSRAFVDGLVGGQRIEVRSINGKRLWSGPVEVADDELVRCHWQNRAMDCSERVAYTEQVTVAAPGVVASSGATGGSVSAPGVVVAAGPNGAVMGAPGVGVVMGPGGMTVNLGGGEGSFYVQSGVGPSGASLGTVVFTEGSAPPPPALPARVQLVVRATDGEWADVLVDGRVVMEIRNEDSGMAWISPGVHTVEVREFMAERPYSTGRLDTGYSEQITLGITEGEPVRAYNHDGWRAQ